MAAVAISVCYRVPTGGRYVPAGARPPGIVNTPEFQLNGVAGALHRQREREREGRRGREEGREEELDRGRGRCLFRVYARARERSYLLRGVGTVFAPRRLARSVRSTLVQSGGT